MRKEPQGRGENPQYLGAAKVLPEDGEGILEGKDNALEEFYQGDEYYDEQFQEEEDGPERGTREQRGSLGEGCEGQARALHELLERRALRQWQVWMGEKWCS